MAQCNIDPAKFTADFIANELARCIRWQLESCHPGIGSDYRKATIVRVRFDCRDIAQHIINRLAPDPMK